MTLYRVSQTRFEMLLVELDLALAMTKLANRAEIDPRKRERTARNSREAFDGLLRVRDTFEITFEQLHVFDGKIVELRIALEELGEQF